MTPGAYQTTSFATVPPSDNSSQPFGRPIQIAITGYVTKLNATGTALIFSTFLGGSGSDAIRAVSVDRGGNVYAGGVASSRDFPGIDSVPDGCRPSFVYPAAFATRLSADGSMLSETQLAYRLSACATHGACRVIPNYGPYTVNNLAYLATISFDGAGKASAVMPRDAPGAVAVRTSRVAILDLFAPSPPLACATDAADYAPLTSVAPGQLLSLFGRGMGPDSPATLPPDVRSVPTELGGVSVTFNEIAAPILYAASGQVNVQVPYETADQPDLAMKINYASGASDTTTFQGTRNQPAAFVPSPSMAGCGPVVTSAVLPLVLNADFTVNSCENPTLRGTPVYLFLNGLGNVGGNLVTGAIATEATRLPNAFSEAGEVEVSTYPGQINSVWLVRLTLRPDVSTPRTGIGLSLNGTQVRESLLIWTR